MTLTLYSLPRSSQHFISYIKLFVQIMLFDTKKQSCFCDTVVLDVKLKDKLKKIVNLKVLRDILKIICRVWFKVFFRGTFYVHYIQHFCICRPSDSTVSEDAGIEPKTVAILVRRSIDSARSFYKKISSTDWKLNSSNSHLCLGIKRKIRLFYRNISKNLNLNLFKN